MRHPAVAESAPAAARLTDFIVRRAPLFVLTGAGCSTGSGIPDYRDADGAWKHAAPIQYRDFIDRPAARRSYWARSMAGWPLFAAARPNGAHRALVALERGGYVERLVTQNVDGLHRRAGSRAVIDLHGELAEVTCLDCGVSTPRARVQDWLMARNPRFAVARVMPAPDGDAHLHGVDLDEFETPACERCGGMLKPAVVFFGESVPAERVSHAVQALTAARGMLLVGTSAMVFSGFRFCRAAAERGLPMATLNRGRTRADALLELKIDADCTSVLESVAARLAGTDLAAGAPA